MTYRITDEPRPGPLSHLVVEPFWPLLAVMLGGSWLGWPWFALNSFAVGSPSRTKEIGLVILGVVGTIAIFFGGAMVIQSMDPETRLPARFLMLAITLWQLGISYWLYTMQSRTFELHRYFGGVVRNGILIAMAGMFLRPRLVAAAADSSLAFVLRLFT